jgi:hypothetical protein
MKREEDVVRRTVVVFSASQSGPIDYWEAVKDGPQQRRGNPASKP